MDYNGLEQIASKGEKIDCLILIVEDDCAHLDSIAKQLKFITQKVDPVSQVLLIDGEGQKIDLEHFYDSAECYIESLNVYIEGEHKGEKKQIPKSITEDTEGIVRLVQLLDSTSWRNTT